MPPVASEPILYARLPDGIVIVRVIGKGTHQQTASLLHVLQMTRNQEPPPAYVIDLDQCTTMDSTFMGTLASIGLHQRRERGSSVVLANIREHVRYLLNTLGLQYILEMRPERGKVAETVGEGEFRPVTPPSMSHLDRIVMMIEAHERLIDVDGENEIMFESVLKSLRDSLAREQEKEKPI